jgi:GAF domain-containing protein
MSPLAAKLLDPGRGVSPLDRRSRVRFKVHTPAYATTGEHAGSIVPHLNEIVDIGEDGMCFQNFSRLQEGENLEFGLDLSETGAHLRLEADVAWSSQSGRTGVRFQPLSQESQLRLRQWLFINCVVAFVNHAKDPSPPREKNLALIAAEESAEPLLPDHTSVLLTVSAIGREAAALGADLDAALQLLAGRALALTRATGAAIALSDGEGMLCRASSGSDAPPVGTVLNANSGFSGACVRTGELLVCEDSESDPRVDCESCRALGVRSMIAAPVRSRDSVTGLLEVFSPDANAFSESDRLAIQKLAEVVNQAVERTASKSQVAGLLGMTAPPEDTASSEAQPAESGGSRRWPRILLALAAATMLAVALAGFPKISGKFFAAHPTPAQLPVATPSSTKPALTTADAAAGLQGLRQLAEKGDPVAQWALGERYAAGDEVKRDYVEAVRWFERAADQGNATAQASLADYYWAGTGVSKDLSKAYFWAILAHANGDQPSKLRAAVLSSLITRQQLLAAQQQANDWLRVHGITSSPTAPSEQ